MVKTLLRHNRQRKRRIEAVLWCLTHFFPKNVSQICCFFQTCLTIRSKHFLTSLSPWDHSLHHILTCYVICQYFSACCPDSSLSFCLFVLSDRRTTSWRNTGKVTSEALCPPHSLQHIAYVCLICMHVFAQYPWLPNIPSEGMLVAGKTSDIFRSVKRTRSDKRSSSKRSNQFIPPVWKWTISWFQRAPSCWLDLSPFHGWNALPCMERESCQ